MTRYRRLRLLLLIGATALGGGCALKQPKEVGSDAHLTPAARAARDLTKLPAPKGKIVVAVYGFRDQSGQYKPSPDSSFSTSVTQGGAAMLIKALKDSGWFTPVEREGLQNVLTERRIIRAIEHPQDKGNPAIQLPPLMPAQVLIEGGIVAYESNVKTGGLGLKYFGAGAFEQYRVDQVTVALRVVDIRSGQILNSVSTTKTIFSQQLDANFFRFVSFKKLLEAEVGFSTNEPAQLAVREAIESGVVHLVAQGVRDKQWFLANDGDLNTPVIQEYLREANEVTAAKGWF
jgi:curli production assembly/transport component CsgG